MNNELSQVKQNEKIMRDSICNIAVNKTKTIKIFYYSVYYNSQCG